uniref:Ribonuclease H-like domain-containing protein n=1 Tax=Tanacetum cinerariifolium TaxID=118510 RepID=A0A6L2JUI4_TANCI|nr:ribonuclease H-like domain-containing protein [Tanacetum cinerariifolium]
MESQSETTQIMSALKILVLKTREYDLWSMRMEQYLTFTDHAFWEVIVNRDLVSSVASANAEGEVILLENVGHQGIKGIEIEMLQQECTSEHIYYNCLGCSRWDSQISVIDKTGLGYDGQMNKSNLNDIHVNESEVLNNVFDSYESDGDDNQVNDRFKKDNSVFKSKVSETITSVPKIETNAFKTSKDGLEKPKTVRSSALLIEEWESDSKDEHVFEPKEVKKIVKPSLEKIKFVNARNTTVENENKAKNLGSSVRVPGERLLIQRKLDQFRTIQQGNQNKLTHPHPKRNFVPAAVLTKSRQVPVNTAKQSSHRAAASVSAARHVNTAASRPSVNNATYSYFKAHSPVRRPFNQKLATKTNSFNEKVNTAKVNNVTTAGPKAVVSVAKGNKNNVVKHMTGNKSYLTDYQEIDGGFVVFGGNAKGGGLTCLFAKATLDESNLWHRRLGHINFKTVNKLVRGNIVRCFPSKLFENDHTCVACQKGKQYKASCPKNSEDEVADDAEKKSIEVPRKENGVQDLAKQRRERTQRNEFETMFGQDKDANGNKMFTPVSAARSTYVYLGGSIPVNVATLPNVDLPTDPLRPDLEDTTNFQDTRIFSGAYDDEVNGVKADFNNLELTTIVSPIPTTRIHKDHPKKQIMRDPLLALQTKIMTKTSQEHAMEHLKLEDSDGISILPTTEIFEQLALMGYVSNSDKLTFQKGHFSPQWRFLIHTILYCLSAKKTAWEQFSSNIATALICLATNRTFNFSKMIFDGMVKNLDRRYEQDMEFDFDAAKEVSTAEQVSTASALVTTVSVNISLASPTKRVSTADDITTAETLVYIRRSAAKTKDKGKGIMEESESDMTNTKRQQEQERLSHEAAMRLQEEFDKKRQRIARVHEAAQTFTEDEWENIRSRVEADEKLTQRLQVEERNKYSEVDQAKILLKKSSFDEIKELFEATMRIIKDFVLMESEDDKAVPKLAEAKSSKRDADEELDQGRSKKKKIVKA